MSRVQREAGEAGPGFGKTLGRGPGSRGWAALRSGGGVSGQRISRLDVSTQKRVALFLSALVLAASVAYLVAAFGLAWGTLARPRLGFFPRIVAFGLLASAVVDIVLTVRRPSVRDADDTDVEELAEERQFGEAAWRVPVLLGLLVAYFIALPLVGHLIAASIMSAVVVRLLSDWRWWLSVVAGIGIAIGSVLVFDTLLGMRLPG